MTVKNEDPKALRVGFFCNVDPETKKRVAEIVKIEGGSNGKLIDRLVTNHKPKPDAGK